LLKYLEIYNLKELNSLEVNQACY